MAMELLVVGLNHKATPIEIREKLAFSEAELPQALSEFRAHTHIPEAVILSTCNRVEIYAASAEAPLSEDALIQFLTHFHAHNLTALENYFYSYRNERAAQHLFEVTASIDSMVVGETQIIQQVKTAYALAQEYGHTGKILNALFQKSFQTAKVVHTHTALSQAHVSISSVAGQLVDKVFDSLSDKTLLIIGAGEVGQLTLRTFQDKGISNVLLCNRTLEKAKELAQTKISGQTYHAAALEELQRLLTKADVVISCIERHEGFLIHPNGVEEALRERRNRPLFFIDLAVPRNIHPEVNKLDNVYLFDVDDLQVIVNQNIEKLGQEIEKGKHLVEKAVQEFMQQTLLFNIDPLIVHIREHYQSESQEELTKTLSRLAHLSEKDREEVRAFATRLLNRFLHHPTATLKEVAQDGVRLSMDELVRKIFGMPGERK